MEGKLSVILVDDEDLVIEDMQALIDWEASGFKIEGYAYNGTQTLKLVRKIRPDIVFMDVSLPDTDGIRLSRQLRGLFPDVVIIILSGFMDFAYAQGAVEIGAISYLVKHQMTPSRLLDVLSQAREVIEEKRMSQLLGSRLLLRDILEHDAVQAEASMNHLASYRDSFALLLLSPVTPIFQADNTKAPIRPPHTALLGAIEDPQMKVLDLLIYHSYLAVFLYISPREKAGRRYLARLDLFIRKLLDSLQGTSGILFSAVHLGRETSLSCLYNDWRTLESHAEDYRFQAAQNIISLGSSTKNAAIASPLNLNFLNRENFLQHNQQFRIQLADCFGQLRQDKDSCGLTSCCSQIKKLSQELQASPSLEDLSCTYIQEISPQVQEYFEKLFAGCQLQSQYSPSTNYMVQYIRQNYNLSPSLMEVSAMLKSSSMYLGQKFKKDTGKTFHDYLNEYRIEQAKKLLSKTHLRIFEVSGSVGIINSQYFSKVFKELTGLAPNEYRAKYYSI